MNLLVANAKAEKNKMIMKKNYFKPEVVSLTVVCDSMIAASDGNINQHGTKPPFVGSNESRGEWGNVWKK